MALDPPPPAIVLATNSLSKIDNSDILGYWLEGYVEDGGTLLVMTQPWGYNFDVLPRGLDMFGYGYIEDQACLSASLFARGELHGVGPVAPAA